MAKAVIVATACWPRRRVGGIASRTIPRDGAAGRSAASLHDNNFGRDTAVMIAGVN
jgi:hypothetical protein